jgi:hypothetical protein
VTAEGAFSWLSNELPLGGAPFENSATLLKKVLLIGRNFIIVADGFTFDRVVP